MKVAIQGIKGSFHDQAASAFFADSTIELLECQSFRDVFEAVKSGQAARGVVAVENSIHGSINQVYRLLAEQGLTICGEVRLHIAMCLVGCKPISLTTLNNPATTVLSHFAAFSQCDKWLSTNLPLAVQQEVGDTAKAVQLVLADNDNRKVAIASAHAAKLYGGAIIANNLNDDPDNYTRFFVISQEPVEVAGANRTSIILHENTSDRAGVLYEALGTFAKAGINLSKLDSHPRPGAVRSYAFYIDLGASANQAKPVLEQLANDGWKLQILGSYQAQSEQLA